MANHKSAEKAHIQSVKKGLRNKSIITRVRNFIKKVEELVGLGKVEEAEKAMSAAESQIQKSVSKGVMKKNTAARSVSRLRKKVKAASAKKK